VKHVRRKPLGIRLRGLLCVVCAGTHKQSGQSAAGVRLRRGLFFCSFNGVQWLDAGSGLIIRWSGSNPGGPTNHRINLVPHRVTRIFFRAWLNGRMRS